MQNAKNNMGVGVAAGPHCHPSLLSVTYPCAALRPISVRLHALPAEGAGGAKSGLMNCPAGSGRLDRVPDFAMPDLFAQASERGAAPVDVTFFPLPGQSPIRPPCGVLVRRIRARRG